jgi:predicted transposase/invertase (TIGR01784 family)
MDIKIHNPHDSFVRRSLANLEVSKDLLKAHLRPAVVRKINWDTIQHTNRSFVKKELAQFHSDVVYKCELDGKEGYIYVLLEHQSTPDRMLPFRILQYNVALMEQHLAEGNDQLPVIINVCLYAGEESPYPYSVDVFDCFELPELARREMFKPLQLIDLTAITQEELIKHGKADLLEVLLKQAVSRDFLNWVNSNQALISILLSRFYGSSGIIYMLDRDDKNDLEKLMDAIIKAAPDKQELIMTAAQQLREQGMQQGIQQGMQQGMETRNLEIAKNLLFKLHVDIDTVQKATELTRQDLEEILKQAENNL